MAMLPAEFQISFDSAIVVAKQVELITKLPEFLKFVEKLFIKASNEIRLGKGLFKGLGDRDKWVQHNNLLRKMDEWQKTKRVP